MTGEPNATAAPAERKRMTMADAWVEARRRWGIDARVQRIGRRCEVGAAKGWPIVKRFGIGTTWEAAFEDAARGERAVAAHFEGRPGPQSPVDDENETPDEVEPARRRQP